MPARRPTALRCACLLAVMACCGSLRAQDAIDARRDVEIAHLRLRLYEQVERPAELRRLRAELTIAEAEAESLRRLLKEYAPLDRFSTGRALVLTIESTRLELLRAELRRDGLKQALMSDQRHHADQLRLLRLELERARAGL